MFDIFDNLHFFRPDETGQVQNVNVSRQHHIFYSKISKKYLQTCAAYQRHSTHGKPKSKVFTSTKCFVSGLTLKSPNRT